jgi:hypothetical protein
MASPSRYVAPIRLSWPAHSRSRRTNFWILPVEVLGSAPNSIATGTCRGRDARGKRR